MARERPAQIPIEADVRNKLKALKGRDSYSIYIDRLMRAGSKDD